MTSHKRFEHCKAKGLKLPDLILPLRWLLKTDIGYKTFFVHNVTLCNSVTFKFWVTLELSRRHDNLKPKRFGILCRTQTKLIILELCLQLFGLLEEISIESSDAFLKSFSMHMFGAK